jgi:hypothetical protein
MSKRLPEPHSPPAKKKVVLRRIGALSLFSGVCTRNLSWLVSAMKGTTTSCGGRLRGQVEGGRLRGAG